MAAKRNKAADADFSLAGTVGTLISGFFDARSESGSASLFVFPGIHWFHPTGAADVLGSGMVLRKVWQCGAAPRIEIVERKNMSAPYDPFAAFADDKNERILQTLALTPANSAWAASWLVDHVEEYYLFEGCRAGQVDYLSVKLRIFDVPETTMTYNLVGDEWIDDIFAKLKAVRGEDEAVARRRALELAYTAGRKERLRSMARTWALVPAAAVVAAT